MPQGPEVRVPKELTESDAVDPAWHLEGQTDAGPG